MSAFQRHQDPDDNGSHATRIDGQSAIERLRQTSYAPTVLTGAGLLVLISLIAVAQPGIWFVLVTLLLGAAFARHAGWAGRDLRVVAMALASTVAAVDYLAWRFTVVSWSSWFVGVPLLLAEAHAALHTVGLQLTVWPKHPQPLRKMVEAWTLPVFIFIPTVDEGVEILGATLRGVKSAREHYLSRFPGARIDIVVCNDGLVAGAACSDDVVTLAHRMGVRCVTRTEPGGAKAGNVENARREVGAFDSALLVIFDADQIPNADFLTTTTAPFSDPNVGWVQTGQFYRNRTNPVARWADDQQSLFYRLLCPAKSAHNAAFICGTNVVIKAKALDEIGGFPQDSVTEDFAASVLLAPRWRSVYLPGVFATGVGPMDFRTYLRQQERWARGTLAVLRTHWPALIRRGSGLTGDQRLQYGLAMTHYLAGVRDLVFVIAPVLFILTGISGVQGATAADFLKHFVPYFGVSALAFWHVAARTTSWRSIAIGFASAPALLKATWMTAFGKFGAFTITPKTRVSTSWWSTGGVYLIGLTVCLGTLVVAVTDRNGPAVLLAAIWTAYIAAMFAVALALVTADVRHGRRMATAIDALEPVALRAEWARTERPVNKIRSSRVAARIAAGMIAVISCAAIIVASLPDSPSGAMASVPPTSAPGQPRIGVSGADPDQTESLAMRLGTKQSTVGRTFEIASSLDRPWAERVTKDGGVPWITLSFGKDGRPTLESSLTAIASGVRDQPLTRWADDIAAFGKPIYLTVLPQFDRDFAVSSAVARGGIPTDAARAWNHIRARFAAAGASNVAWVWTPADPSNDAQFAPPASAIDAVAVSWYEYPNTAWTDPAATLAAAAANHPGRPLLLEVSAPTVSCPDVDSMLPDGTACGQGRWAGRDEWLRAVADAVNTRTDIAAVVYHDSGPFIDPADPNARAWRLPDPSEWARMYTQGA